MTNPPSETGPFLEVAVEQRPAAEAAVVTAVRLLRADAPGTIMGAPQDWPRWVVLFPHVIAAAGFLQDHIQSRVATSSFTPHPGDEITQTLSGDVSWLLDRAGTFEQVHARLHSSRTLFERALAIDEATYGPDHPTVGTSLNTLALVLYALGEPGAARPLAERALAIAEATYGPDHPDVGNRLNTLALVLSALGEPGAARPLAERAQSIRALSDGGP